MDEIEFVKNMQVLEIKPGDLIVLRHPGNLSVNAYQQLRDSLVKALKSASYDNHVILLEEGIEIGAIRQSEKETIEENGFASGGLVPEKPSGYYSKLLHGPR